MLRLLSAFLFAAFAALTLSAPAKAGDYYYDDGYSSRPRYSSYYDDGYRYRPYRSYRSSDCCYRKVTRYQRVYSDYDRPRYRSYTSYDDGYYRPYRSYRSYTSYDDGYRPYRPYYRPYRSYTSSYYDDYPRYRSYSYPSYRYSGYSYSYPSYRYSSYSSYPSYSYSSPSYRYGYSSYRTSSYSSYDQPRSFYPEGCRPKKYKVYDDQGGWVWGKRTVCW